MIKNAWYIATKVDNLVKKPYSCTILGEPIVLYRDAQGNAYALYDRCSHRGVPLSKGKIKDNCLVCCYHGWTFNDKGKCVYIPEVDHYPQRTDIKTYPVKEQQGYVWVFMGQKENADIVEIPKLMEGPGWRSVKNTVDVVNCDWMYMMENAVDGAHLSFIHSGSLEDGNRWLYNWSRKFRKEQQHEEPNNLKVSFNNNGFVAKAEKEEMKGNKSEKLAFEMEIHLPSTVQFKLYFGEKQVRVWVHVVPIENGKCRVEHVMTRDFLTTALADWLFHKSARKFLTEDVQVVELQQPVYERDGDNWEVSVSRDRIPLIFRKEIKKIKMQENLSFEEQTI
ncbi:hypothetical protein CON64_11255 [Bacillus pseudomycoides]|nr:hypothetical protein CON64_11255 [Bacillus pseudomycoides]